MAPFIQVFSLIIIKFYDFCIHYIVKEREFAVQSDFLLHFPMDAVGRHEDTNIHVYLYIRRKMIVGDF